MILDGSELSFSRTLYLLDISADISGLKVNCEKTEALWIDSLKNSNTIIPSNKPITWGERKVYALGVWFSTSDLKDIEANFFEKIEKKMLSNWSARRLTLLGRIAILKSLAVHKFFMFCPLYQLPKVSLRKSIPCYTTSFGMANVIKSKGQK